MADNGLTNIIVKMYKRGLSQNGISKVLGVSRGMVWWRLKNAGYTPRRFGGNSLCMHHKDGDSSNNVPDNLQIVTLSEHVRLHNIQGDMGKKRITPPNSGLSWCSSCKQFLLKKGFSVNESRFNNLSQECKKCRKVSSRSYREKRKNRVIAPLLEEAS